MRSHTSASEDELRVDETGEVDLEQIEYNLSLTPDQRLRQYFDWMALVQIARQAGRDYYGMELRTADATD